MIWIALKHHKLRNVNRDKNYYGKSEIALADWVLLNWQHWIDHALPIISRNLSYVLPSMFFKVNQNYSSEIVRGIKSGMKNDFRLRLNHWAPNSFLYWRFVKRLNFDPARCHFFDIQSFGIGKFKLNLLINKYESFLTANYCEKKFTH